jgi:general L-amino acid transport system substrate-binding protein
VTSALELNSASVCVQKGTTSQANLADYFRTNGMQYKEVLVDSLDVALASLESGGCDVMTADVSALYAQRLKLKPGSSAIILPDVISKEPLGPVTRSDDIAWFNIVKWTVFAVVNAEELGINKQNAASLATSNVAIAMAATETADKTRSLTAQVNESPSQKPDVLRFIGAEGDFGKKLGLDNAWALRAIAATGNYAEVFERNLGTQSKLGIPRGLNQLWSMGGILYAPPMR